MFYPRSGAVSAFSPKMLELREDTEDLPDQIETGVQFSQIKAKQINKRTQSEDELCARHHTKTWDLWRKKGFLFKKFRYNWHIRLY